MAMHEFIKKMREKRKISQENLSGYLGCSRQTYTQIENGNRDITLTEMKKLAGMFDIPLDRFVNESEADTYRIEYDPKVEFQHPKEIRVRVSHSRVDKFKEVLLYILSKIGAKPNIGETVLYKLLYFIDFDYYAKYEEKLIGADFIKNHFGPTPVMFKKVTDAMITENEIDVIEKSYYEFNQKKYLPRRPADLDKITAREIKHIDEVLERLSDKNAKQLSDLSHKDIPWLTAKEGEKIDYKSVLYRKTKHRMAIAAEVLYEDYCSDEELTVFSDLDMEDFYEAR